MAASQALLNGVRHPHFQEKVFETARRVVQTADGLQAIEGDEEWLRQAVHGFMNVILEATADSGSEVRDTFLQTVVPGLLAEGQPPAPLIKSTGTFLFLIGAQLVLDVAPADQPAAMIWFATFAGSYLEDLYMACGEAKTS